MYNSGLNPDLVKTGLDEVFFGGFDNESIPGYAHADNGVLFKQGSATNSAVISNVMGWPGEFTKHSEEEEIELATIRSDHKATNLVENWKRSFKIPVEFFEDEEWGAVNASIRQLGIRARTTQDKNALGSGYSDGFTSFTVNSGTALFSNSHTTLAGGTVDNLETGTLSESNLETLVNSLIDQKGQDDSLAGHMPAWLLVPTTLFKEAMEITKSELRSGTANNDLNYYSQVYPGLRVYFSPFLGASFGGADGGSDTAYFVGGSMHAMNRDVRVGMDTDMVDSAYDDRDRYTYKARFREVVHASSFEGLVASDGTV